MSPKPAHPAGEAKAAEHIRRRVFFAGLRLRPVLQFGLALGIAGIGLGWASGLSVLNAVLLGWCIGAGLHVGFTLFVMTRATPEQARARAAELDPSKWRILLYCMGSAMASLIAVVVNLAQDPGGLASALLAGLTIIASWCFIQTLFAHHYMHEYWLHPDAALDFPGNDADGPDVWEFLYFSATVGLTFQVSDVETRGAGIRRMVLAQALMSYVFSTVIVASAVSFAAGLLGGH